MRHASDINDVYKEYEDLFWRTGRRVGQCVHAQVHSEPSDDDVLLFECPSPDIAALVVKVHNFWMTAPERVWEATEAEYQANHPTSRTNQDDNIGDPLWERNKRTHGS